MTTQIATLNPQRAIETLDWLIEANKELLSQQSNIIIERCDILNKDINLTRSSNEDTSEKDFISIVNKFIDITNSYTGFVLTSDVTDLDCDDEKLYFLKLCYDIRCEILRTGKNILNALSDHVGSIYMDKVEKLLKSI